MLYLEVLNIRLTCMDNTTVLKQATLDVLGSMSYIELTVGEVPYISIANNIIPHPIPPSRNTIIYTSMKQTVQLL